MKILREPLVHFLAIGATLFTIYAYWGQPDAEDQGKRITITAGEIEWLTDSWQKRWNRPPTALEREGFINQYVREMILYREAKAMGLDRNDSVIRRRLGQKLEFLSNDLITPQPPTEDELRSYFTDHMDRYQQPDLITFTHIFFDPDKRGNQTLKDAETAKAELIALQQPPQDIRPFGDKFMLQNYYPERSEADVAKLFGSGFAGPVFQLTPQQWHGPVLSGYGTHLVYVHGLRKIPPPEFAEVEEQLTKDWTNDQREKLNEQFIASLMDRYEVTIEDVPNEKLARVVKE